MTTTSEALRQAAEWMRRHADDIDNEDGVSSLELRQQAALLESALSQIEGEKKRWRPIDTSWRAGKDDIIVTDGQTVTHAYWVHTECCWSCCIVPTMWQPFPAPPGSSDV